MLNVNKIIIKKTFNHFQCCLFRESFIFASKLRQNYPEAEGENFHDAFKRKEAGQGRVQVVQRHLVSLGLLIILLAKNDEKRLVAENDERGQLFRTKGRQIICFKINIRKKMLFVLLFVYESKQFVFTVLFRRRIEYLKAQIADPNTLLLKTLVYSIL